MRLEDCDFSCSCCQRPVCGDDFPSCPHDDELACDGCCERFHEVAA